MAEIDELVRRILAYMDYKSVEELRDTVGWYEERAGFKWVLDEIEKIKNA